MIESIRNKIWYFLNRGKYINLGKGSIIVSPLKVNGKKNISIGNCVTIKYKTWLASLPLDAGTGSLLEFGDGCCIGNFNHIYATKKVIFGRKVLTADKVYISDNLHSYEDITKAVLDQPLKQSNEVHIGDGTWIGENVCIMGCTIGKHCVIGANAVVTKNIPDHSVVVGNPAKIIKRYCFETKRWKKTDITGNFID